jgi:hypothetical protein
MTRLSGVAQAPQEQGIKKCYAQIPASMLGTSAATPLVMQHTGSSRSLGTQSHLGSSAVLGYGFNSIAALQEALITPAAQPVPTVPDLLGE